MLEMTNKALSFQEFSHKVGEDIGVSSWFLIDQARINTFADVTEDHQFIHVDEARAAQTPLGGTIAHGYLVLSLASAMAYEVMPKLDNIVMQVNYGLENLRFLSPVRSGKRVRGHFTLGEVSEKKPGQCRVSVHIEIEIEDEAKPALSADLISLTFV